MLLVIHNLPGIITYNEIKDFLRNKCGLDEFILDNLENENSLSKRITVGLAEESDAAILVRKVNGMYLKGQQLFIENIRQKKSSEQPYNSYNAQQGNMKSSDYNNSAQNNSAKAIPNAPIPPLMNPYQMLLGNMPYMPVLQAPAVANERGQQQWSADPAAYQNNAPFYQQQSYQSPEMQRVTPAFLSEAKQVPKTNIQSKNRNDSQFQNVAYPDRVDRSRTFDNNRGRYNAQNQERGVNDDQNRDHSGYRDGDLNHGRDGNRDCGLNRGDRIVKFVNRDSTCNVNVNREQEPMRAVTARESRWDIHVRNIREWASNDDSAAEHSIWKNEKNQPSQKTQFGDRSILDRSVTSRSNEQFPAEPPSPFSISYNRSQFECSAPTRRPNYNPKESNVRLEKPAEISGKNVPHYNKQDNSMKRKFTPNESNSSNQECKLPERNLQMSQKIIAPSSWTAPPGKKLKPNEIVPPVKAPTERRPMAYSRRIKKHKTWICQAAANLAREVLKSEESQSDAISDKVLVQLKKCILTRIDKIYCNHLAESLNEVLDKYKSKFKFEKYCDLYKGIRDKVENDIERSTRSKSESRNTTATRTRPRKHKQPISPSRHLNPYKVNPYKVASQNTPSQNRPGPQTKKSSITKPAVISEFEILPDLPESVPADIKLPTYPLGDKKLYKQMKESNKLQQGVLSDPDKMVLQKEIEKLQELFVQGCREADAQLKADYQTRWEPALDDFKKCVRNSVTKRILNIRNNLMVRIFFTPKRPKRTELETFIKNYDAISLKKSDRNKMFIATCGTFSGFDALCKLEKTQIGDVTVTFKPLHLIGDRKKDRSKRGNTDDEDSTSDESDYGEEDQINEDIAECHQELLNDTDVVLLEEEADIINLDETNDEIKPDDEDSDNVKDHDKNIDTIDEISQNDVKLDEPQVTVDSADTKTIVIQNDVKCNEDDKVTTGNTETEVTLNEMISNTVSEEASEKRNSPALVVGDNSYLVLDDVDNDDHNNDKQFKENLQDILSTTDIREDDLEDF